MTTVTFNLTYTGNMLVYHAGMFQGIESVFQAGHLDKQHGWKLHVNPFVPPQLWSADDLRTIADKIDELSRPPTVEAR